MNENTILETFAIRHSFITYERIVFSAPRLLSIDSIVDLRR